MTGDLDTGYLTRLPADQRMVLEEVNGPGLAALRSYLDSGEAVAFLGAGVSAPLYPLWAGLIGEMVDAAAGRLTGKQAATCRALATSAPEEVVEIVRHSLGLPSYHAVLREVLRVRADPATNRSWTVVQELVCRCAFRGVVTTNYDPGIVDARMRVRAGASATGFMTWQDELGLDEWRTGRVFGGGELPVLYAHGVHSQPDSVVLAASDYRRAYAGKLAAVLERLADGGHLCWIGFSFADQRLTAILREVPLLSGTRHEPGIAPAHVAVMAWDPAAEANDPGILAQRAEIAFGAQVILYPASGGDHSALAALLAGLADARFPAVTARAGLAAHVAQTHGEGHDSRGKRSKNAEQGRIAGTEQARILADALRAAWLIDDEPSKASALFEIAQAVAPTDPDRAAGLTNDAERVAQSITDWDRKQSVLRELALALAATDPDRAERVAQSITGWGRKQSALTEIALAVSASDPDCAERIAQSITDERSRVSALIEMATAVSASDPDRAARLTTDAERVAQSITDKRSSVPRLKLVVKV